MHWSAQYREYPGRAAGAVANLHGDAKYRRADGRQLFGVRKILEAGLVRAEPEPMRREFFRVARIDARGVARERGDPAVLQKEIHRSARVAGKMQPRNIVGL